MYLKRQQEMDMEAIIAAQANRNQAVFARLASSSAVARAVRAGGNKAKLRNKQRDTD